MKIDDQLAEVFDSEPVLEGDVITAAGELLPPEDNADEYDFQKVRDNMHTLMEYGKEGIEFSLQVAKNAETPASISVFTQMIDTLTRLNTAIIDMHDKRKKIKKSVGEKETLNQVNNNVFVGTTTELKQFLKEMKNKE